MKVVENVYFIWQRVVYLLQIWTYIGCQKVLLYSKSKTTVYMK